MHIAILKFEKQNQTNIQVAFMSQPHYRIEKVQFTRISRLLTEECMMNAIEDFFETKSTY